MTNTKPTQEEVNTFLNTLRDSGITNMFGARPYIIERFNVSKYTATSFLLEWMETYKPVENNENS